jgi:virginiamycin B lyase
MDMSRNFCFLAVLVMLAVAPALGFSQTLKTYNLPFPQAGPWDIALGADGNMWFTEGGIGDSLPTKIGRVSSSGQITEFFTPSRNRTGGIVAGADGKLWFTIQGFPTTIGNTTTAGVITEFCDSTGTTTPGTCSLSPQDLAFGPDGNLWFTEHVRNAVVKMNPGTGSFTFFSIGGFGFGAQGIAQGPDNALWFTINSLNPAIGRVDTAGNIMTFGLGILSDPRDITLGPDGNLWFTQPRHNSIGRITPEGMITLFSLPTLAAFPWAIITGPDGNLWFTQHDVDRIGRITPSGVIADVLQAPGGPWGIARGTGDTLWITLREGNKIGEFTVSAPPPPAAPAPLVPYSSASVASPVAFDWSDVATAISYELQVDDSASFTAPLVASVQVALSQANLSGLPAQGLWWRVRAQNPSGVIGAFSIARNFSVQSPGGAANLSVTATGRSGAQIVSTPAGISVVVGSSQTAAFAVSTAITLTASSNRSAIWSGACSSAGNKTKTCTFTLSANASVTANVQ